MKYIKAYENIDKPKKGDYVYCEVPEGEYTPNKFIGKFIRVQQKKSFPYLVFYKSNDPQQSDERIIREGELIFFSKSLKELESKITSRKYNL